MQTEQDILDYTERYKYCMENHKASRDIGKHNRFRLDETSRASYWLDQANDALEVLKTLKKEGLT
jgi:hypothetical protein